MNDKPELEPELLLNGEPYAAPESRRAPSFRARWNRRLLVGILLMETCFVLPKYAHGQFLSIFDSIFSSIQNDIGSSLSSINQVIQQTQKLYQTTLAPLAALNQARGFVANSINSFRGQMNQIFNTPFTSAVTPGPQQFESISAQPAVVADSCLADELYFELWGDPAGQHSLAAGPRDDGRGRRTGPGEPEDHAHRRPGRGRHPPDRQPDGEPGCGQHARLQSLSHRAGAGRKSPLPGIHAEDACGGVAAGGGPHRARQRSRQAPDSGDRRNQQPDHGSADGAIEESFDDGSKEESEQTAQVILLAAQAHSHAGIGEARESG